MAKIIQIHKEDNVAVAIEEIKQGESFVVAGKSIMAITDIPAGHKVALRSIREGEAVIKYGCPIGNAMKPVSEGEWIHIHNIKTGL